MESDQDRVFDALHSRLSLLEGPWPSKPHWWEFGPRRRDKLIQQALSDAGLPPLTDAGRRRYYLADQQGYEDALSAWSRKWCAALGLAYREAWSNAIHPRLDAAHG